MKNKLLSYPWFRDIDVILNIQTDICAILIVFLKQWYLIKYKTYVILNQVRTNDVGFPFHQVNDIASLFEYSAFARNGKCP